MERSKGVVITGINVRLIYLFCSLFLPLSAISFASLFFPLLLPRSSPPNPYSRIYDLLATLPSYLLFSLLWSSLLRRPLSVSSLISSGTLFTVDYSRKLRRYIWGQILLPLHLRTEKHARQKRTEPMRYLHTMIRAADLGKTLSFFVDHLGLVEVRRYDSEQGRFTLVFLAAPGDADEAESKQSPLVEITYNWDPETYDGGRNFGHLAYRVDDIYATCQRLMDGGVTINRPPRDGRMAFVKSPDGISIELLQKGEALAVQDRKSHTPLYDR